MDGPLTRMAIAPDDPQLQETLATAGLPISDLGASAGRFFRFERNGVLAGFGGYEPCGGDALLRSLVVVPNLRGAGVGTQFASDLMSEMEAAGVGRVYLLTEKAEGFFSRLGFATIARDTAPEAILATPQASSICRSAALMSRAI